NDGAATKKYYYSDASVVCSSKIFDTEYTTSSSTTKPYVCAAAMDSAGNIGYSNVNSNQFKISSTIQGAIDSANPGDTIQVGAGSYTENLIVNKSLNLKGASSSSVTINALSSSDNVFTVTANSVNISGFTISGANVATTAGIYINGGVTFCNISNNILTNNGDGIWLGSGSNHNTFMNNNVSNNLWQGFEVYISRDNTFTNNTANSNANYGFKIDSGDNNTFIDNTANSNTKYGFYVVTGDGGGATNTLFTNNTANSNTQYGIRINGGTGNTLTGNTFNSNGLAGIRLKENILNLDMQNNNINNNPTGIDIDSSIANFTGWTITNNNIVGNTNYYILNIAAGTINAINNWFGITDKVTITGKISGNVVYTPWAYAQGLYDGTNPTIGTLTITPKSGDFISGMSNINATVSDGTSGVASCEYTLNGTDWNVATYSGGICTKINVNTTSANSINIRATDNSGNIGLGSAVAVTSDTTAPSITITNPNTNPAQSKTITATGGDGTLTMSVTTGTTCDGTLTFIAYADTTFTDEVDNGKKVCYKSIDAVGNIAYSLSNAIAGIDRTAPSITITNPNTNPAQSKTITATGGDGTLTMSVNAAGVTTCDGTLTFGVYSSTTFSLEADNTRTVCYKSIDAVGNIAYSLSNAIAGIDTTFPSIPDLSPKDKNISIGQTVTFVLNATDANSVANVRLYNKSNVNIGNFTHGAENSWSHTSSAYNTIGNYKYYVKATDSVGNIETTSEYTITVNDLILDLSSNWNLVSVPKTLVTNSTATLLPGSTIYQYSNNAWVINPAVLSPGVGYWIDKNDPTSLGLNYASDSGCSGPGCTPSTEYVNLDLINDGWSLIGLTTTNSTKKVNEVFVSQLTGEWVNGLYYVIKYNEGTSQFDIMGATDVMTPGEGYWVYKT
ncbi:MAG: NosD domain-containing protein, partial [Nanoarchaeota archaeon]|nr:NosD domain-containing protein [Nanoarchaeota archaeon]